MTTQSEALAYLRRLSGDEQILACLHAMTSNLHGDDPTCVILDDAIAQIEANLWAADTRAIMAEKESAA